MPSELARRIADEGAAVRFLCASVLISAHGPSFVHFARDGREWIFRTYDNARVVYTAGEYYDELPKEMGEPWNQ